ncbi:MAG TPA: PEP-CTERM sorting domain-containing protein [Candidatus Sulfotelmatobacter sp.]|nr:PEP-CTERM sorting domain-containing protein [Candidatus Sulfotelmatobacter sp.]HWI59494.1 PEP-CTERM sorting domain-containing protein [Bacillota bacterium]
MKTKHLVSVIAPLMCFTLSPTVFGQMSGNNILYTPTGNLSAGPQNTTAGSVGGVFLTSYSVWPYVNWLGYYDKDGDGLANSHEVSLWYTGGQGGAGSSTPLATVTVPAGTAAPLVNGYRWVQLPSKVDLWYGSWYVIAAQADGVDTWGDLVTAEAGQVTWDNQYVGDNAGWSRAGRYDTLASWPNPPGSQSGSDAIYPVANLAYNLNVVPEPTSLSLLGLGTALYWGLGRRRKN